MEGEGEFDPTATDKNTTGGASEGTDDSPQDWQFPDDTSDPKRKFRWPGGARPKVRYEKIPVSEIPKEKSGLPHPKGGEGTAETSFTGLDYSEAEILYKIKN